MGYLASDQTLVRNIPNISDCYQLWELEHSLGYYRAPKAESESSMRKASFLVYT